MNDWQEEAACKSQPELFFSNHECDVKCDTQGCDGEKREKGRREREALAKAICADCPVLQKCKRWALGVALSHGIAGGMTRRERIKELAKRRNRV